VGAQLFHAMPVKVFTQQYTFNIILILFHSPSRLCIKTGVRLEGNVGFTPRVTPLESGATVMRSSMGRQRGCPTSIKFIPEHHLQ